MVPFDSAPADISKLVCDFHTSGGTAVISQSPMLPILEPADFLIPKWKTSLKGQRFDTMEEMEIKYAERPEDYTETSIQETVERCISSGSIFRVTGAINP